MSTESGPQALTVLLRVPCQTGDGQKRPESGREPPHPGENFAGAPATIRAVGSQTKQLKSERRHPPPPIIRATMVKPTLLALLAAAGAVLGAVTPGALAATRNSRPPGATRPRFAGRRTASRTSPRRTSAASASARATRSPRTTSVRLPTRWCGLAASGRVLRPGEKDVAPQQRPGDEGASRGRTGRRGPAPRQPLKSATGLPAMRRATTRSSRRWGPRAWPAGAAAPMGPARSPQTTWRRDAGS